MSGIRAWLAGTTGLGLALPGCATAVTKSVASPPQAPVRAATRAVGMATFDSASDGLRLDYPRSWQPQKYEVVSSFTSLITYLSPQQLHDPCTRSANEVTCSPYGVLRQIDPDGVLVSWSADGFPIAQGQDELSGVGGSTTTVGGHRAKINIQHNPTGAGCGQVGGDELITAGIERGVVGNYFVMTACFRGPSLTAIEQEVQSMLDSVKILTVSD